MSLLTPVHEDLEVGFRVWDHDGMFMVEERVKEDDSMYEDDDNSDWMLGNEEFFSVDEAMKVFGGHELSDGDVVWHTGNFRVICRNGVYAVQRSDDDGNWWDGRDPRNSTVVPSPQVEFASAIEAIRFVVDWE